MKGWNKLKKYVMADLSQDTISFSLGHWETDVHSGTSEQKTESKHTNMPQVAPLLGDCGSTRMAVRINENVDWLKQQFSYPQNSDLVFRPFAVGRDSTQGMVVYLENQIDWQHLNETVIKPLISTNHSQELPVDVHTMKFLILTNCHITSTTVLGDIVQNILAGSAAIIVDGLDTAVIADVSGGEKRSLESPKTESVIRGQQVGFTEDLPTNLSMIRRRLKTPDLIIESGNVGKISRTRISIVYLKSITNVEIVEEVRRRISSIQVDYIGDSGMVEQMIEDSPNSIYPGLLATERPDRLAALVADGYVGILVDNSPYALIAPTNFPLFLQTSEDAYLRWQFGSFLRIIRLIGFVFSLYLPAVYIALANYHQEMIPTALILAIANTRETVPLPVAAEAFLLESMFELIREAGVRIPSVIGPTIGIVGALILGQAAVQANIVSPIVVIITSVTALASYTIPNYSMQFSTRILRFVFLGCASFLGLIGVILMSIMLWLNWMSKNRFGVPALAPISPRRPSNDTILRGSMQQQTMRAISARPRQSTKIPDEKTDGQGGSHSLPPEQGGTTP
ncbi:spore germination protein [Paenibacillus sp. sgz302251]|uniref:spore germination protein n=1 Tax=Paenibacillus sp. sgz302251 TaxID=3414493 RepID=UPI003C7CA4E1